VAAARGGALPADQEGRGRRERPDDGGRAPGGVADLVTTDRKPVDGHPPTRGAAAIARLVTPSRPRPHFVIACTQSKSRGHVFCVRRGRGCQTSLAPPGPRPYLRPCTTQLSRCGLALSGRHGRAWRASPGTEARHRWIGGPAAQGGAATRRSRCAPQNREPALGALAPSQIEHSPLTPASAAVLAHRSTHERGGPGASVSSGAGVSRARPSTPAHRPERKSRRFRQRRLHACIALGESRTCRLRSTARRRRRASIPRSGP
jgi:hypothetical protein